MGKAHADTAFEERVAAIEGVVTRHPLHREILYKAIGGCAENLCLRLRVQRPAFGRGLRMKRNADGLGALEGDRRYNGRDAVPRGANRGGVGNEVVSWKQRGSAAPKAVPFGQAAGFRCGILPDEQFRAGGEMGALDDEKKEAGDAARFRFRIRRKSHEWPFSAPVR